MDGNYIKINRSMLEWEWYRNINTKVLFLHMLLKANWKAGKFEGKEIERGSFVSSYPRLMEECDLTVNELRTAIKHLVSTGEITVKTYSKYSVFTIKNYCLYQDVNSQITVESQADDSQGTDSAQSVNSLLTTIEEKKEEKEGNKGKREEGKKKDNKSVVAASRAATFAEDSFEMLCVNTLVHSCLEQFQGAKVPETDAQKTEWCSHIEKMIRLDKRSEDDIKVALEYAVTDSFWKTNIRSTKKFREKFETLLIQAQQKGRPSSRTERIQNRVSEVDNW